MKTKKVILCTSQGESKEEFIRMLATHSMTQKQDIIACFQDIVVKVSPMSSAHDITQIFEWAENNRNTNMLCGSI